MVTDKFDSEYFRRHRAVFKARGRARNQFCKFCNKQAKDWAQVHNTSGSNPYNDYIPLCRSCHCLYDGIKPALNSYDPRAVEKRWQTRYARYGNSGASDNRSETIKEWWRKRQIIGYEPVKLSDETKMNMTAAQYRRWKLMSKSQRDQITQNMKAGQQKRWESERAPQRGAGGRFVRKSEV